MTADGSPAIESHFELVGDDEVADEDVIARGEHARADRRVTLTFRLDASGPTTMLVIEQSFFLDDELVHEDADHLAVQNGTMPNTDETPTVFAKSLFEHNPELLLGTLFERALSADDDDTNSSAHE